MQESVNLLEEPDAGNPQVRFCEGLAPTDVWLRYCGTAGKPGGKRRKQTSTCISGETGLLDSIEFMFPYDTDKTQLVGAPPPPGTGGMFVPGKTRRRDGDKGGRQSVGRGRFNHATLMAPQHKGGLYEQKK